MNVVEAMTLQVHLRTYSCRSTSDQPPRSTIRASFEPGRTSTSSEQCPLSLISRSFNCAINPGLGHTTGLARTSSPSASFSDIEHFEIRYAAIIVGERDTPATQCTRTFPPLFLASVMTWLALPITVLMEDISLSKSCRRWYWT
jgi:hypothetical protein